MINKQDVSIIIRKIVLAIDPEGNDNILRFALENNDGKTIIFLHNCKTVSKEKLKNAFIISTDYYEKKDSNTFSLPNLSSIVKFAKDNQYFSNNEFWALRGLNGDFFYSVKLNILLDVEKEFIKEQQNYLQSAGLQKEQNEEFSPLTK